MGSTQQGLGVSIPGASHIPKALGHDPALSKSSERGWGVPFPGDKEMPSHGSCCPPGSLIRLLQLRPGLGESRHWPKPALCCLSRVGKALPGSVSGRLNLSQNKHLSSFQLLFPTGLVCSLFLLQYLDSPASNYCLQLQTCTSPWKKSIISA